MSKADDLWNELAPLLRKAKGFAPLTAEEAQKDYDEVEPVDISQARIQEIVDYATGKTK